MTTDAWRDDAWTDTKANPDEPDWYYERGLPNTENGSVVLGAMLKWRRRSQAQIDALAVMRDRSAEKAAAEWIIMPRFDPHSSCCKCASRQASVFFIASESQHNPHPHDVLSRKCERCGYEWYEKPLDAERDT